MNDEKYNINGKLKVAKIELTRSIMWGKLEMKYAEIYINKLSYEEMFNLGVKEHLWEEVK